MQTETILEIPACVLSPKAIPEILRKTECPCKPGAPKITRSFADLVRYMTEDRVYFRNGDSQCATIDVPRCRRHRHADKFRRKWLELYEDRQTFRDGSVLRRKRFNGIGETLKRSETPRDGAVRCLAEELGFRLIGV